MLEAREVRPLALGSRSASIMLLCMIKEQLAGKTEAGAVSKPSGADVVAGGVAGGYVGKMRRLSV